MSITVITVMHWVPPDGIHRMASTSASMAIRQGPPNFGATHPGQADGAVC